MARTSPNFNNSHGQDSVGLCHEISDSPIFRPLRMTLGDLSGFLSTYGLALLLPLAVVEGPVVSVLAGILCSQNVLNWYWVLPVLVLGDLIGDLIYYAIGRFSHARLQRLAVRLGVPIHRTQAWDTRVAAHTTRMLLIGKWTHAVGALVLVTAGAVPVGLGRFLLVNMLATIPKSMLLLAVGEFVGPYAVAFFDRFGWLAPIAMFALGVGALWMLLRRHPDMDRVL